MSALLGLLLASAPEIMTYDNITSEVVFENDRVIAQHFVVNPGQTTGMHLHRCKQMEILLSTGKGLIIAPSPNGGAPHERLLDMKKGDLRFIEPSPERHEFRNVDSVPIEWMLVTLKGTCVTVEPVAADRPASGQE